ncbi:MAG: cytochrome c biogenesis protein [Alphaproteobacteria bacterium]
MRSLILFIVVTLGCIMPPYTAQAQMETAKLAQIPILHEGRIKPIDSFARSNLKSLSGKDKNAMAWLTQTLFDPARAEQMPVIKITNPEVLQLLHLDRRKDKLYSYGEISKLLAQRQDLLNSILSGDKQQWTTQQRDLIKLHQKVTLMRDLLGSLSLTLPLSFTLPDIEKEPFSSYSGKPLTYLSTIDIHTDLSQAVRDIYAQKSDKIGNYTDQEQALTHLSYTLSLLEEAGRNARLFKVLPNNKTWYSPWGADKTDLEQWQNLATAYHTNQTELWDKTLEEMLTTSLKHSDLRPAALKAEYYYNTLNPFKVSFALSLCALSLLLASLFKSSATSFKNITFTLLISSLSIQSLSIATRMYILERAPVSTLYETILFVCFVISAYVISAYYKNKNPLWLWIGTILGTILHLLGFSHNQDGDSMLMLTAVLNTNFWLSTHVLCITAGYGFCALTSILAHYTLGKMIWTGEERPDSMLFKHTHLAALFALLFTGIGTVLGGIWADQSWGRFWGWDPKENGALLIVLWIIWVVHGRLGGQMNNRHTLYGLSYVSVILALSWFGVNLLGVGLHSYGFTDSAIWGLSLFTICESLFIIGCILVFHKRKEEHA